MALVVRSSSRAAGHIGSVPVLPRGTCPPLAGTGHIKEGERGVVWRGGEGEGGEGEGSEALQQRDSLQYVS